LAVGHAEQSVTYADQSGDAGQRMLRRTTHADGLHQAGRRAEAEARFRQAEQMQKEDQPDHPLLYSVRGFLYCDLLLAAPERAAWQLVLESSASVLDCASPLALSEALAGADHPSASDGKSGGGPPHSKTLREVRERAAQTVKWVEDYGRDMLSAALDHLMLGRAALYEAILEGRAGSPLSAANDPTPSDSQRRARSDAPYLETARRELDAAVAGLRRAAEQEFIVRGLLTRAWLRFLTRAKIGHASAQEDLDEAWEIAERGPMKLFMADIHLYRARLFGGQNYPWESPAADLKAAEELIKKCGYHRRDEELADAEAALPLGND